MPTTNLGLTKVVTCADELDGPLKQYRWFAMSFGQDFDLFRGSFEEAVIDHIDTLTATELQRLHDELSAVAREIADTRSVEEHKVEDFWYKMGAQVLPSELTITDAIRLATKIVAARVEEVR